LKFHKVLLNFGTIYILGNCTDRVSWGGSLFPVVLEFIVKLSLHKTLKVHFSVQENIYSCLTWFSFSWIL